MPELPDVEGFRKYLEATSLHRVVSEAVVLDERIVDEVTPEALRRHVEGSRLEGTGRHGKYLFAALSRGGDLVLHFGMSGSLRYHSEPAAQPEYTRFALKFKEGGQLSYVNIRRLGRVSYADSCAVFLALHELGPDALAPDFDSSAFRRRLEGRKGSIKAALMNQSILAGIGNEYSDEILFQAGIDPRTTIDRLNDETLDQIYAVMRRVLKTAADHNGHQDELPDGWLLPRLAGGDYSCPGCEGEIHKVTVSGRTAHYCPGCQKLL